MFADSDLLETTCMNIIDAILLCLENATKGTIYSVGPMPELRTVRITSGVRGESAGQITWGLPEVSDYNGPGKTWREFRDQPGRILEAMGWCVQMQKSWTSDNPHEDYRSVRKQLSGEPEDFHHMEPVLLRKRDIFGPHRDGLEYPTDWQGLPIWQDTDYVVVGIIKIHFRPYTIERGDRSSKVIKKLSRSLATEMLSLHLRESYLKGRERLARQRLQSCNVVAHELRNATMKLSFAFSAVNAEFGFLRERWEMTLKSAVPGLRDKSLILERLEILIRLRLPALNGSKELMRIVGELLETQRELKALYILPEHLEKWVDEKVQPKWNLLLTETQIWKDDAEEVRGLLAELRTSFRIGLDAKLIERVEGLPKNVKSRWPELIYTRLSRGNIPVLNEILELLDCSELEISHKLHTRKVLLSLKSLIEIIPEIEERSNIILSSLKNDDLLEDL
jgi:hypothetical protein